MYRTEPTRIFGELFTPSIGREGKKNGEKRLFLPEQYGLRSGGGGGGPLIFFLYFFFLRTSCKSLARTEVSFRSFIPLFLLRPFFSPLALLSQRPLLDARDAAADVCFYRIFSFLVFYFLFHPFPPLRRKNCNATSYIQRWCSTFVVDCVCRRRSERPRTAPKSGRKSAAVIVCPEPNRFLNYETCTRVWQGFSTFLYLFTIHKRTAYGWIHLKIKTNYEF